jgi:hypothetical protein
MIDLTRQNQGTRKDKTREMRTQNETKHRRQDTQTKKTRQDKSTRQGIDVLTAIIRFSVNRIYQVSESTVPSSRQWGKT